jgi:hypothetical protein
MNFHEVFILLTVGFSVGYLIAFVDYRRRLKKLQNANFHKETVARWKEYSFTQEMAKEEAQVKFDATRNAMEYLDLYAETPCPNVRTAIGKDVLRLINGVYRYGISHGDRLRGYRQMREM